MSTYNNGRSILNRSEPPSANQEVAKGGNVPGEDGPYRPPNPADAPPYPPKPTKITKKNKGKKGDPESEYSRPLKGAPPGHNIG